MSASLFPVLFVSLIQQSVCSLQNILKLLGYWEITKVFFFCFCFLKICAKKALEKMNVLAPVYVAITHCIRLHNLTKVTHIWMKYPTYSESSFSEKIQSQRNSRSHRQRPVWPRGHCHPQLPHGGGLAPGQAHWQQLWEPSLLET